MISLLPLYLWWWPTFERSLLNCQATNGLIKVGGLQGITRIGHGQTYRVRRVPLGIDGRECFGTPPRSENDWTLGFDWIFLGMFVLEGFVLFGWLKIDNLTGFRYVCLLLPLLNQVEINKLQPSNSLNWANFHSLIKNASYPSPPLPRKAWDFEDCGVLKSSSFSRKMHHTWRP